MTIITRMYTGDDGESHIEDMDLADHPELAAGLKATDSTFRTYEPGHFIDWHQGPKRQLVVNPLAPIAVAGLRAGAEEQAAQDERCDRPDLPRSPFRRVHRSSLPWLVSTQPFSRCGPTETGQVPSQGDIERRYRTTMRVAAAQGGATTPAGAMGRRGVWPPEAKGCERGGRGGRPGAGGPPVACWPPGV